MGTIEPHVFVELYAGEGDPEFFNDEEHTQAGMEGGTETGGEVWHPGVTLADYLMVPSKNIFAVVVLIKWVSGTSDNASDDFSAALCH